MLLLFRFSSFFLLHPVWKRRKIERRDKKRLARDQFDAQLNHNWTDTGGGNIGRDSCRSCGCLCRDWANFWPFLNQSPYVIRMHNMVSIYSRERRILTQIQTFPRRGDARLISFFVAHCLAIIPGKEPLLYHIVLQLKGILSFSGKTFNRSLQRKFYDALRYVFLWKMISHQVRRQKIEFSCPYQRLLDPDKFMDWCPPNWLSNNFSFSVFTSSLSSSPIHNL